MLCSKESATLINTTHKRALRAQYMRFDLKLDELLKMSRSYSIHTKYLQLLLVEVYKTLNRLNPSFMWNLFQKRRQSMS